MHGDEESGHHHIYRRAGHAGDYDQTLLQNCASHPTYFYAAASTAQLQTVLNQIGDNILYNTLRRTE